MKAQIVIGSNFGDENKGLTVDYLCSLYDPSSTIVVRHNGGAGAGHTVELANGDRHVFHHFGSGSFQNIPTFLSQHFIVNPTLFIIEAEQIAHYCKDVQLEVLVNENAPLTTPFDVMINTAAENARSGNNHGSCGVGINETVHRNETEYATYVKDIKDINALRIKLYAIRGQYLLQRETELNLDLEFYEDDLSDDLIEDYLRQCTAMLSCVRQFEDNEILQYFENVVFEGAQGLLLDEHHSFFPHVTRSRTGIYNAVQILKGIGVTEAEVYYVTRSYLTRHGAGPLPHEVEGRIYDIEPDQTNVDNKYQADIRYAPLNLELLENSIENDIDTVNDFDLKVNLVVTCVNQLPFIVNWVNNDIIQQGTSYAFIKALHKIYPFDGIIHSDGKTRESFKLIH